MTAPPMKLVASQRTSVRDGNGQQQKVFFLLWCCFNIYGEITFKDPLPSNCVTRCTLFTYCDDFQTKQNKKNGDRECLWEAGNRHHASAVVLPRLRRKPARRQQRNYYTVAGHGGGVLYLFLSLKVSFEKNKKNKKKRKKKKEKERE